MCFCFKKLAEWPSNLKCPVDNIVLVQNRLALFRCVLEKDRVYRFSLLSSLSEQLYLSVISLMKTKKKRKRLTRHTLAPLKAGQNIRLTISPSITPPVTSCGSEIKMKIKKAYIKFVIADE